MRHSLGAAGCAVFFLRAAGMAATRRVSHRSFEQPGSGGMMAPPSDSSQPRLAAGCRWGGTDENRVILFPEGAIKLQGTGRQVLEHCDGQRTFGDIIRELQSQFAEADPNKIRDDISKFLEQLQQ